MLYSLDIYDKCYTLLDIYDMSNLKVTINFVLSSEIPSMIALSPNIGDISKEPRNAHVQVCNINRYNIKYKV